ncbi:MAG: hypothetical protein BRD50_01150 [Bacteroidetes bacterium SW_11_45_7]|nr:MAG: hypothetical protein BRD50_01150 [Bacteroidetes bacterium SW_11_45_7]
MNNLITERITVNPDICHGKPTIRNTRMMVESVLEYLAAGDRFDNILNEFPDLEKEDILACLAYANQVLKFKDISFKVA